MAFDTVLPTSPFGAEPHKRVDGVAKVTGAARYATDEAVANPAFAYLVTSSIARGRVTGFDLSAARAVRGYIDCLNHENIGNEYRTPPAFSGKEPQTTTLESDRVWHDGQIVAVVVAETFEAAREAANKVVVRYEVEAPSATFDSPGVTTEPHKLQPGSENPHKGDAGRRVRCRPGENGGALCDAGATPQSDRAVRDHLRLGRTPPDGLRGVAVHVGAENSGRQTAEYGRRRRANRIALCRRRVRFQGRD